ncbi:MAG: cobyrinic acid a,c-diamide synthase [Cyanothece sp. SIO2G6]|nr:cobyrinic acid a,c-diamide synthase [Cyanothece sp. SIO2G6]
MQANQNSDDIAGYIPDDNILSHLPESARVWFESLSWHERRYVLSLCHLMCVASPEAQADFLDGYTADGLVSKKLSDRETKDRVEEYLRQFKIDTPITKVLIRQYIRQFYVHSAQDTHRQPVLYLESALKLIFSNEERNNVFNYVLGFELFKMMFKMSWLQHERLYLLQRNQDEFIQQYIKPIQHAHRLNGIVVPKDEGIFFAQRQYYIAIPHISGKKLVELVMATFTTEKTSHFGFSVIRHVNALAFDYDYIFAPGQDAIFT